MQASSQTVIAHDGGVSIVDILMVEHQLLREQMHRLCDWLGQGVDDEVLRERAALLAVALERHARMEEEKLFASLRRRSDTARRLVEPMEIDHDEIRTLFGEIRQGQKVRQKLELVLELADRHFTQEEQELFPLAVGSD